MNWIKENKFLSVLAGGTLVLVCVLIYFSYTQGSAYSQKVEQFREMNNKFRMLNANKPYPNQENLAGRNKALGDYQEVISNIQEQFAKYEPVELSKLSPEEFSDRRVRMEKELIRLFTEAETKVPEECHYGFEAYADVQAKAHATAKLNYELDAMKWLLEKLAHQKPIELISIKRYPLEEEREKKLNNQNPRNRNRPKPRGANKPLYERMPVEIIFTATESSVRNFLKEIANSEKYFYTLHALRISSEKQSVPALRAIKKSVKPAGKASNTPQVVANTFSQKTLNQLLGSENLHVFLSMEILLIKKQEDQETATST